MDLVVNGAKRVVEVDPTTPLLWVLRDALALTGTKFGCGVAACGACTVRVAGQAVRSCVTPVSVVAGKPVQTIEGLADGGRLHRLQQAWIDEQVPQRHRLVMAVSMSASVGRGFLSSSAAAAINMPD